MFQLQSSCYNIAMRTLKSFENELNKCSNCGLCETVCPIFKLNKNDCAVSRGKFLMLQGIVKGDLKLSKNINKYLDMCIKCGKCSKFCPSGIDAVEIFNTAKYEYMKATSLGKIIERINLFSLPRYIGRFMHSDITPSQNKRFRASLKERGPQETLSIIYFRGCVNNILPNTDKYLKKIFKNVPINIVTPDFECCGLPYLSEGNMKAFIDAAMYNAKLLKGNYDYLVTDCASCEDTILNYHKYIKNFGIPQAKSVNWGDIIAQKELKFRFKKSLKVTFHKPCHLHDDTFFERIMANCENIEYVKADNYDECCGCAGTFILKNRKLSKELSRQKALNIDATGADYVITTCPACILGLKQGLHLVGSKVKVVSLLEFLALA